MNLFYLDLVAKKSARYHCNKHVVKLILEATQILYGVWHVIEGSNEKWKIRAPENPMKLTHTNHPLSIWARTNTKTYDIVSEYCLCLLDEYTLRYGKVHSCTKHMDFLAKEKPKNLPVSNTCPVMPLCMPDQYKVVPTKSWQDVVDSYRAYYIGEKLHFCAYKDVDWPDWLPPKPVVPKEDPKTKKSVVKKTKTKVSTSAAAKKVTKKNNQDDDYKPPKSSKKTTVSTVSTTTKNSLVSNIKTRSRSKLVNLDD
ncbi:hypothetical protein CYY_006342 [Polysphondylium violaceum]|uniref:Uncharacterized protein n=1 Tax=Polysphondylium violaceum TaxID=133409 RepID=A0A8J4V388_9MYCE|nr:hypothetical protein CYY_006342 [Polysphondylium violaceum]